ncbi:MAG TPA: ATP-binding protein [Acidocella sp.]|nr:ATP-binding protein [Acidocella sp.]
MTQEGARRLFLAPLNWLAGRLRGRPDSEHEMSFNRLGFAAIIVAILISGQKNGAFGPALHSMIIFIVLALTILGHIIIFPKICQTRRILALLLDCGFLSWQIHLGGQKVALFYPVYLWVIFGNGFRFGLAYLAAAVPVAAVSFALVVATTPFWRNQLNLSVGLLIGLIILPAYAGTLIRKLSLATRSAEEANNAKSLFLASVSHELRTPLTAIVGMSGLLRRAALDEEQQEMVETINLASISLQTLINGLLDLSRIEAGRMPNVPEELDLLNLLVDVRRIVESQVVAKNLSFDIHVTPRTPPFLLANRQHLLEIILNLAGNAVKFTENGGVVIAVDGHPAEGSGSGVNLTIDVSDTGIGIAPYDQTRIFEDFTQANDMIMNRFGGTGLGLALTKRRVELFGGTINVESTLGKGSTFHVSIMTRAATNATEALPADKVHVTLVARNREIVTQVRSGLSALGVAVTVVEPGRIAQDPAAGQKGPIMLVHAPDWDIVKPAISATDATVVLIDEAAAQALPSVSTQKRCVTVLSDVSSVKSLNRVVAIALRLTNESVRQRSEALEVAASPPLTEPARCRRVLLVDDNRVNQRVFTRILESAGHEVLTAENGEKALDVLEHEESRLDVVLMDFNMPELDGIDATKLFRLMTLGSVRLPIIGLTADASAEADARWRNADMDGCLIKPVDPAVLLDTIDAIARKTSVMRTNTVAILEDHPRFRKPGVPALDETIVANLRRLGDSTFIDELFSDFLIDATDTIESLSAAAAQGNTTVFRNQAHALQSSASNVGARALAELCAPWVDRRGAELRARAVDFTTRAQIELSRTRDAIKDLNADRGIRSLT